MQSAKIRTQKVVADKIDSEKYKPSKGYRKKHVCKRKVKVDKIENMERLVITQKVDVKKQKYKCIIDLTNICEHKRKHTKDKKKKSTNIEEKLLIKKENKKAIKNENEKPTNVPKRPAINANKGTTNIESFETKSKKDKDRIVPKCDRYNCTKHRRSKPVKSFNHVNCKRSSPKCDRGSLSLLSNSIISVDSSKLYEDISSDSFYSDEEIDCLIKRTKDRERKLSLSFEDQLPLKSSTPYYENVSDAETVLTRNSGLDTSLHSTTTLVLQPKLGLYSPSHPTSPTKEDQKPVESKESLRREQMNVFNTKRKTSSAGFDETSDSALERNCYIKNELYSPTAGFRVEHSNVANTKYSSSFDAHTTSYLDSYYIKNEPYSSSETQRAEHTNVANTKYPSSFDAYTTAILERSCHIKNEPYSPSESPVYFEPGKYTYEIPIKSETIEHVFPHGLESQMTNMFTKRTADENFNNFYVKPVSKRNINLRQKVSKTHSDYNSYVYTENNNVIIKSEHPETK
ncbi:hypothetical protein O0L34_g654 [Tuta absoluta]|nr:hypothetical protein O0L34_g654 [Tuta absoluta]